MQHNVDQDMDEVREGITNDRSYAQKYGAHRRGRELYDARGVRKTLILWSVGILLLALVMVLLFRGDDKEVLEELAALKERVGQLEKRQPELERAGERVARLEGRVSGLKKSISKLNRAVASKSKEPRVVKKTPTSPAKGRFHKVRPGDTLYGIAGKYGLTVNQLRRYNNMDKNQGIRPGQKLRIEPNKP
jgi:LysM repeat protein